MDTPPLDIVQAPKWMKINDLPVKLVVNTPFEVNGELFVLQKIKSSQLKICKHDNESSLTSSPVPSADYYVIKRVL